MVNDDKKNEIIRSFTNIVFEPVFKESTDVSSYKKYPIGELASLASGLSSLPPAFRTVTQTVATKGDNLFRMFTLPGATGNLQIKNGVTLGTLSDGNRITARARFQQVDGIKEVMETVSPINPTMLFVAVALICIEKEISEIKDNQKEIIQFLEMDKRSKQKGNFIYLSDVLNNYKYNWDNDTYKKNMYLKVQDIKQESEQNILFYKQRIINNLGKQDFIVIDQMVNDQLNKIKTDLEDYQLAVYLFGYSSFLEVLLLENFDEKYLKNISKKMNSYALEYRDLYSKVYEMLELKMKSSVESGLIQGFAITTGFFGKVIGSIPFVNQLEIDETMIAGEEEIKKLDDTRIKDKVRVLQDISSSKTNTFAECIDTINKLYNEPTDILVDKENLYIRLHDSNDEVSAKLKAVQ